MTRTASVTTLLLLLLSILAGTIPVGAGTVLVPSDHATIQAGIDAATDGDTVMVAPGTYAGAGNRALLWQWRDISLISEGGASSTIIECGHTEAGFIGCGQSNASVIEGFTIRNGGSDYGSSAINNSNSARILNCVIESCSGYGAAIGMWGDEPTTISGCTIRENWSLYDAALDLNDEGHVEVVDCTIVDNQSGDYYDYPYSSGAGVKGWNFTLNRCTIARNTAYGYGAGVYGLNGEVIDCEIYDNEASRHGGGLLLWYSTVTDCRIVANSSWEEGGAVCAFESVEINDCIVTGNRSATIGGGIYCTSESSVTIRRSTIASNFAADGGMDPLAGGGIYCDDMSHVLLDRTILWGNCSATGADEAYLAATSKMTAVCCALDPGAIGGDGEIHYSLEQVFADPLFCDPLDCVLAPSDLGDFTLDAFSPCLPGQSPCGELIGALDLGCGDPAGLPEGATIAETTWGALKAGYR